MKVVICMPDNVFKKLVAGKIQYGGVTARNIFNWVKEGKSLPKGHGRLIDVGVLRKELIANEWITDDDGGGLENILHNSPIIIEADKEADTE